MSTPTMDAAATVVSATLSAQASAGPATTNDLALQFRWVSDVFAQKDAKEAQIAKLQADINDLDAQITAMSSRITPIANAVAAYVASLGGS